MVALAQINPTVGDIAGNSAKILEYYERAKAQGAELVVFPELALIGYPPEDLVLMPSFQAAAMDAAQALAAKTAGGPAMIVGSIWQDEGQLYNAALLMDEGKIRHVQRKQQLPTYGIFDEKRIFAAGGSSQVIEWRKVRLGMLICEDVWSEKQAAELKTHGAELVIVVNASPFEAGKWAQRHQVAAAAVKEAGAPLVYVNMVGGQDDIVFDGGSFVMSRAGEVVLQMAEFEESLNTVILNEVKDPHPVVGDPSAAPQDDKQRLWSAMCLGLADYVRKNGFTTVVLGLSGGIDSALTAAAAVDALGAANVKGVLLPSPYTSQESTDDALETARLLGIETMTIPITPGMETMQAALNGVFSGAPPTGQPLTGWIENPAIGGNLQARLRGVTLMALSNAFGWMLLSTGNKSEIAVGYSTLYGDACGSYNVLKDVYKTQVYALAKWRNKVSGVGCQVPDKKDSDTCHLTPVIPMQSITKAPTAELAPGQKDEDQLPPYAVLDAILARHIEGRMGAEEIIAQGFERAVVEKVLRMVRQSEYKRRQSCPGVKLSPMLFGKDRRYPLTNTF